MIRSFLLYASYTIILLVLAILSFLYLAPQFGSNPTPEQKDHYKTFSNYKDNGFKSLEGTPMMTGEVSTWDFFMDHVRRSGGFFIVFYFMPEQPTYAQQ